jgi:hypothetical protein
VRDKGFYSPTKSINHKGDAMSRIVTEIVSCENQIRQFFLNQKAGSLLKRSNINKKKGIASVTVFRMLFTTVFTGKNLFRTLVSFAGSCCPRTQRIAFSIRCMPTGAGSCFS